MPIHHKDRNSIRRYLKRIAAARPSVPGVPSSGGPLPEMRIPMNPGQGKAEIDTNACPAGINVSDAKMGVINVHRHQFHGD